jgi:hypothetical protein
MKEKRASSQIDWVISLGIFLLYLAWFFVYVRGLAQPAQTTDTLLSSLRESFIQNTTWTTAVMPLFVRSNTSGNEPIITDFRMGWTNFSFSDNSYFELRGSKMFFIKDLKQGVNTYYLAKSDDSYPAAQGDFEMYATDELATVNSQFFTAEIEDSLVSKVGYDGITALSSLSIAQNSNVIDTLSAVKSSNISPMLAEYKFNTQGFNMSTFVIAGFPRIYGYMWLNALANNNVTITLQLANYTQYYVNEEDRGSIAFNLSICRTRETRYIDFYNSRNGLTIIAPEGAKIRQCQSENGLEADIEMFLANETAYELIFHEGEYNETQKYLSNYAAEFGMPQNITGISLEAVGRINSTAYPVLKGQWQYPEKRDFNFILSNSSNDVIYDYSPVHPSSQNVFAKQEKIYVVNKYGEREMYSLRLLGW